MMLFPSFPFFFFYYVSLKHTFFLRCVDVPIAEAQQDIIRHQEVDRPPPLGYRYLL